jgi:hypothetical protein
VLDPSSISCSLFDDSENESYSENEEDNSENDDSPCSSEFSNEEDFDENEMNEYEPPNQSKVKNKNEYLKYLSSINSTPIDMGDMQKETEYSYNLTQEVESKQNLN